LVRASCDEPVVLAAGNLGNDFACSYADTAEIEGSLTGVFDAQAASCFFTPSFSVITLMAAPAAETMIRLG
jgi:hypothetical protein